MEQQVEIGQYIQVLRRRKWYFLVPAAVVFAVVALVAFLLPPSFRSEATILIETQEIPESFIQSTVTGYIEERLQTISQIVLSRQNLLEVIQRFNLYADERESRTTEEIIGGMREDITMEPVQAEVINPRSGRPGTATVAFTVAFEGRQPQKVTQVTSTLVSLYLEENLRTRKEKAETTYDFLEKQLADLKLQIEQTEEEIARFKEAHLRELPELMQLNLQTLERLQKEIDAKQERMRTLADRKIYLQGQLATIEPVRYTVSTEGGRTMTPEEELKLLKNQYLSLTAVQSEKHPDVIALKRKIEALEKEVDTKSLLRETSGLLESKRLELVRLKERYTDKHPDVIRTEREVEQLEQELIDLESRQVLQRDSERGDPENPAYINLTTQITSTEMDIENERREIAELRRKYAEYQRRIELTPQVEQEYRALERNYANAQAKYQETLSKLMAAREAKGLEESAMAEKLTLIDPPTLPEKPFKPNRLALLLIGMVLATGVGVGTGSLAEFLDRSVHSSDELGSLTGLPILVTVPYLETREDRTRRLRRRIIWSIGCLLLIGSALLIVHLFIEPLDILWYRLLQRLQPTV